MCTQQRLKLASVSAQSDWSFLPALVSQLDARPTGDLEVAGSTAAWFVDIDHDIFYPFPLIIPPTYEVCGVYSFRFSFDRSSVSSFVLSVIVGSVFALKFIRPHILKTLRWISFIFGLT